MTPEQGVEFNAAPIPPAEYLMRRSYNPNDVGIPGSIVREWGCPAHGVNSGTSHVAPGETHASAYPRCPMPGCFSALRPHAVDVPLVKSDGGGWA